MSLHHSLGVRSWALATTAAVAISSPAFAQAAKSFDIPAQPLATALEAFGKQSGTEILFDRGQVAGKTSSAVIGAMTPSEALGQLTAGSGMSVRQANASTFVVSPGPQSAAALAAVEPAQVSELTVTGSHIRRSDREGPSPVIVLSRQDLERTGRTTVAEAIAQLPQNFASPVTPGLSTTGAQAVNLRGLGEDNTLVLINGRRVATSGASGNAPFVDLNSIPFSAVERIEVLPDGASAIYGADAVTGVVNIILKKDFRGSEVSLNGALTQDGGASEFQPSFVTGWSKGGFNILLSGEYFKRDALAAAKRSFSNTDDLRERGGSDLRTTVSNPGNVFSLNGLNLPGLNSPFAGIPAGQDGRHLTPGDFAMTQGHLNLESVHANFDDLVPAAERYALNASLNGSLLSWLSLYAEAGLSHDRTTNPENPPFYIVTVPSTNAFNPFGQPVQVRWLPSGLTSEVDDVSDNRRFVLGLREQLGKWEGDSSLSYSRDRFEDRANNAFAIAGPVLTRLLASSDPSSALNVFGDGPRANSPEVLAALNFGHQTVNGVSDLLAVNSKLDGPLLTWGEGRTLSAAVGWEYRRETFDSLLSTFQTDPSSPNVTNSVSGAREVIAAFLELDQPLFGPENEMPGLQKLELQLAVRAEHYSDFGDTTNPKLALIWKPVSSLAVRGSVGTSFRAPSLRELFGVVTLFPQPVVDPRRNNESVVVPADFGGNLSLKPEKSQNWNVGVVWDAPFLGGLSLTVNYWSLRQNGRITSIGAQDLLAAESLFPGRTVRATPTPADIAAGLPGRLTSLDLTNLNATQVRLRGADFEANYRVQNDLGDFDLHFAAAQIFSAKQQLTRASPVQELAGTLASSNIGEEADRPEVKFKGKLSLFWTGGAWSAGVTERYTGRSRDPFRPLHPLIADHAETDLQVNYVWPGRSDVLAGSRVSLSVVNLFNSKPPFRDLFFGFPTALYDPRGAVYQVRLTKAF